MLYARVACWDLRIENENLLFIFLPVNAWRKYVDSLVLNSLIILCIVIGLLSVESWAKLLWRRKGHFSQFLSDISFSIPPILKYEREAGHNNPDKNDDEDATLKFKNSVLNT